MSIQAQIDAKAAPRVTRELVESRVSGEEYFLSGCMTICVLTLVNGINVVGTAACVSPENYDEALGRSIARGKAIDAILPLEAYALANRRMGERDMEGMRAGLSPMDGTVVETRLTVLAQDDVEAAKRIIRLAAEPNGDRSRLGETLALLTPCTTAVNVFGAAAGPFDGLLDHSIAEIEDKLPDLDSACLLAALNAEMRGKTRKGAVRILADEIARRANGD